MSGSTQTISTAVTGPVFSNGGAIAITNTGSISKGREGVFAKNFSITTLSNMGSIGAARGAPGRAGGIGVLTNSGRTINLLTNANGGTISGGDGGNGRARGGTGGAGGTGVSNAGTITTLTSAGMISGGSGGRGGTPSNVGAISPAQTHALWIAAAEVAIGDSCRWRRTHSLFRLRHAGLHEVFEPRARQAFLLALLAACHSLSSLRPLSGDAVEN